MKKRAKKLPQAALDDPFKPPDVPVQVECIQCGDRYSSDEMVWVDDADDPLGGGWWCRNTDKCDGAGFGFDVIPLGERKKL